MPETYYTYVEPGQDDKPVYVTKSRRDIICEFYPEWSAKMMHKYGEDSFHETWTVSDCVDDWVTIHMAWESNNE
jgi:hypothetical protein